MSKSAVRRVTVYFLSKAAWVFENAAPRQGNLFGFVVTKREAVQPWLVEADGDLKVNVDYLKQEYDPAKYRRNTTP